MAQIDKTFPTLDCSACILTPKMVEVANHPNVRLITYSEVEKVEGYVGNFEVTIRQKARSWIFLPVLAVVSALKNVQLRCPAKFEME